jgi:hypothetical protein
MTTPTIHRVPMGTMAHKPLTLRRSARAPITTAIVPHRAELSGPCSLLMALPVQAPFASRGGMPPRPPRCQFAR